MSTGTFANRKKSDEMVLARENLSLGIVNNKRADQPVQRHGYSLTVKNNI